MENPRVTFLNPFAGILAGAIATPILLLFYFLKLRRRPLRISSTLLWRRAVRDLQVNEPFRWLKPSWLLLIQLLALASLCVALARPALDAGVAPARRVILLIDTSASMNATDAAPSGGGADETRLEEARQRAQEIVDRLAGTTGATEAAVVSFAARPVAHTGLTGSRAELARALAEIEPTDQPADFAAALKLAGAIAARAGANPSSPDQSRTRVIVLGDGSYGPIDGASAGDMRFIRVGPAPDAARDNLGVVAIAARRALDDPSLVRIFARVVNASRTPVSTPITLLIDGAAIQTRQLDVTARSDEAPGEATVTFEFHDAPTGKPRLATVFLAREDALASDNAAALRLEPTIPPRVLIVVPPVMPEAQALAVDLLHGGFHAIGSTIVDTLDDGAYDGLRATPDALDRYDLIVFDGGHVAWLAPVPTISFGALVAAPGRDADRDATIQGPVRFTFWRRSHPILRQVSLDNVLIARARDARMTDSDGHRAGEELASGPHGPLISLVHDHGVDRVYVGFELSQSTWPVQVDFIVFLTNAVEHLTRLIGEATATSFTTTEAISVRPEPGAERVRADGPATFVAPVDPARPRVDLGALPRAGVYHLTGVVEADRIVPVNLLDARESAIQTRDTLDIPGSPRRAGTIGAAAPREIWRWFALVGLALLTMEWLLYAWRMRV